MTSACRYFWKSGAKVEVFWHKKGDKLSPPCRFFLALVFFGDFLVPLYVSAV